MLAVSFATAIAAGLARASRQVFPPPASQRRVSRQQALLVRLPSVPERAGLPARAIARISFTFGRSPAANGFAAAAGVAAAALLRADRLRRPAQQAFPQPVQVRQAMSQIPLFPSAQRRPLCYLSFVPPQEFRRPTSFSCLTFQSPCTAVAHSYNCVTPRRRLPHGMPEPNRNFDHRSIAGSIEACECMLDEGFVTFFTKYPML